MVGSKTLKVVSVLWIVFGIISLGLAGIEVASAVKMSLMVASFMVPVIVGAAWAVLQIAAGFLGVKFWNRPEKAKVCMVAAALVMVSCLVYNVYLMMYGYTVWTIISIVACAVPAVLYFLGANYNNKLNA